MVLSKSGEAYGFCPICGYPGAERERRPDGDTKCCLGHKYKSTNSILTQAIATPLRKKWDKKNAKS